MEEPSFAAHYLIIRFSSLGDVVKFLPASACLKKLNPTSKVTWITSPRFAPLLRLSPDIDRVIELDPLSWRAPLWSLYRYVKTIWHLRRNTFDVGIDFHSLWSSGLLLRLCHTKQRISAAIPNKLGFIPNAHVPLTTVKTDCPEDFYLTSLSLLGVRQREGKAELHQNNEAEAVVKKKLQSIGFWNERALVVLHPGSAESFKCWPMEDFLELRERIVAEMNVDSVFLIGPKEQTQRRILSERNIPFIENLSLPMLVALLRRSAVLVDHDSGPLQLAGLLNRRTVGIFGPSITEMHRPYGERGIIVRGSSCCTSCFVPFQYMSGCERGDMECLQTISVDQVFRAVRAQLMASSGDADSSPMITSRESDGARQVRA